MKLKATLLVGLMSLTLISCGGSSTKSEWNEAELALIQEHLYNVELPYYYIEGNGELTYNENFDGLVLSGASVTSSELDAYASKFDLDVWTMGLSFEKDMIYAFTQEVETEDDVIYYEVLLCAKNADGDLSSSGTFFLEAYAYLGSDIPTYNAVDFLNEILGLIGCSGATINTRVEPLSQVTEYYADINYGSGDASMLEGVIMNIHNILPSDVVNYTPPTDASSILGSDYNGACWAALYARDLALALQVVVYLNEGNIIARFTTYVF